MFSKATALLLLVASAIAGSIPEGTYKITNVGSEGTARAVPSGGQISVSSDGSDPGPFELWTLKDADSNGYTIENVGLNTDQMLDSFAAVGQPMEGAPVVTNRNPTVFNIDPASSDGTYVIRLQNDNLVWNVEPPVVPAGNVALRRADGQTTQKWSFTAVEAEA